MTRFYLYVLLLAGLSFQQMNAQPVRLKSVLFKYDVYHNHVYRQDTATIFYANNTLPGTVEQYYARTIRCDSILNFFTYDNQFGNWRIHRQENAQGLTTKSLTEEWSGAQYERLGLDSFVYDVQGNKLEEYTAIYSAGVLSYYGSLFHKYDAQQNNIIDSFSFFRISTQSWEPGGFFVYGYTPANLLQSSCFFEYNSVTQQCDSAFLSQYFYNTQSQIDSIVSMEWIDGLEKPYAIERYTYDAAQNNTYSVRHKWDLTLNEWTPSTRIFRFFDGYNRNIKDSLQHHQNSTSNWQTMKTTQKVFGSLGGVVESRTNEYFNSGDSSVLVDSYYYRTDSLLWKYVQRYWDTATQAWKVNPELDYTYYYEPYTPNAVNTIATLAPVFNIYPNPASSLVYVEMPAKGHYTLTAYNTEGKQMAQFSPKEGIRKVQLPVAHWPKGVYWIRLRGDDGTAVKSFVVQ